jgi:hypothetical protein
MVQDVGSLNATDVGGTEEWDFEPEMLLTRGSFTVRVPEGPGAALLGSTVHPREMLLFQRQVFRLRQQWIGFKKPPPPLRGPSRVEPRQRRRSDQSGRRPRKGRARGPDPARPRRSHLARRRSAA